MSDTTPASRPEKVATVYLKATAFLLPPLLVLAIATIFVFPKIKQMCADVGYDPGAIFRVVDLVRDQAWALLVALLSLLTAFEMWIPLWRRHRSIFVALLVCGLNSAVLVQLLCTLVVTAIVGPQMRGR